MGGLIFRLLIQKTPLIARVQGVKIQKNIDKTEHLAD